jgi:hypothetical protein
MAHKKVTIVCLLVILGLCVRLGLAEDQTQGASFMQTPTFTFSLPSMNAVFECFQMPTFSSFPMSLTPQDLPSALRPAPINVPVIVMPNTDYQDRISLIVQSRNNALSQDRFIAEEEKNKKFERILNSSSLILSSGQETSLPAPAQEK